MRVSETVIYRCVAGEHILVPIGSSAIDTNGLVVLNEVGAEVWNLLAAEKTLDEIVAMIAESYDAEPDIIRKDVQELLQKLIKLGFVLEE